MVLKGKNKLNIFWHQSHAFHTGGDYGILEG